MLKQLQKLLTKITGNQPKLFQLMDSDSDSRNCSSNCDGIELVSDLGSEMSKLGYSDNEPEPSSPALASSPAPFVNDSNNDNNSIFSDASNDDEDVPYPDEHPP